MGSTTVIESLALALSEQCQIDNHINHGNKKLKRMIISPLQVYQVGLVLYETRHRLLDCDENEDLLEAAYLNLCQAYVALMGNNMSNKNSDILNDILNAFDALLLQNSTSQEEDIRKAVFGMCGLYIHSKDVCQIGFQPTILKHCASLYNRFYNKSDEDVCNALLELLSAIILHGQLCIENKNNSKKASDETNTRTGHSLLQTFHCLSNNQDEAFDSHIDILKDLQQWQKNSYKNNAFQKQVVSVIPLRQAIQSKLSSTDSNSPPNDNDNEQLNYILLILDSSNVEDDCSKSNSTNISQKISKSKSVDDNQKPLAKNSSSEENQKKALDQMINRVHSILPHLGKGYIEVALNCYNFDVEQTVAMLLDDVQNLHPRLRVLDKSLGRSTAATKAEKQKKEDEEAKAIQKQKIQEMEKKAEKEAFLLDQFMRIDVQTANENEYDDDYDDQYDGVQDPKIQDQGLYDVDMDMLKEYNRTVREIVRESEFWDAEQNTNRQKKNKQKKIATDGEDNDEDDNTDNGSQKKYRGHDKGKGGRILGPDGKPIPFSKKHKNRGSNQQQTPPQQPNDSNDKNDIESKIGPKKNKGRNKSTSTTEQNNNNNEKKSDTMTKQQKRRKNDNKAKVGNHNRKSRALKKMG